MVKIMSLSKIVKKEILQTESTTEVVIVGSGFGGLCAAIKLLKAGITSFRIIERGDTVGGTWRDNTYPGAACDIPSHLYSFSFDLNPNWSRTYPAQKEILEYMHKVAKKHDLLKYMQFNTSVKEAKYDSDNQSWIVYTTDGLLRSKFVIFATGGLSEPVIPNVPGIENFKGKIFHSAKWDHDYDLKGKKVASIGTGASAIQFVPRIADKVEKLTVFQRTAPWIVARKDFPYSNLMKSLFRNIPGFMRLNRWKMHWLNELMAIGTVVNPKYMDWAKKEALGHLNNQVPNASLREKLTPNYVMGCKRILISNEWYPALQRTNVNLETSGIKEVTENGIISADGKEHPVDAIVFGTGFAASESLVKFPITGRHNVQLTQAWKNGAEAYLGASVAGFPNMFLITGPNTGLGHNSMIFIIEANVAHIMGALTKARKDNKAVIEVKREIQDEYNVAVQERLKSSVWVTGCKSWYQDPKTGKVSTLWPGFSTQYWNKAHKFNHKDYSLF
ncbi:MAG: cation diffusion facilitator CzcD-associated flavoprotein CzcO [Cognaticolwellia sp.]|jgi:cation diffusion facilitator CzcD-associated flavoprotein CzcO